VSDDNGAGGPGPGLALLEAWHVDNLTAALKATKTSIDELNKTIQAYIRTTVFSANDQRSFQERREALGAEICERLDRIEEAL
jgi:hypothetical protein